MPSGTGWAVGTAFFLSGSAALIYQVAWQRILALHSGVGIYSVALITAAFMAGLGLGSHWGGVWSERLGRRSALAAFAGLELGVGLFSALSPGLYYDWLYDRAPVLYGVSWQAGLLHFAALVVPTTLMGMSLPFLVRAMVRDVATAGRTIGTLYGINVLGAALGAGMTPWVLIRFSGIRGAIYVGVLANVLAAALAALMQRGWSLGDDPAPGTDAPGADVPAATTPRPFGLWLGLYALSGFCALSLEILWFRLIDVGAKATAFSFGTVLAIYLLGLGSGSLVGSRVASRIREPLRLFLLLQCLLLLWSGAVILAVAALPPDTLGYQWFVDYWGHRTGAWLGRGGELGSLLRLYALGPIVLYGPPTFLMGLSFVALQRAVHDDPRTSGRKVGALQAANIAGCTAGSLVVGLVSLSWLGTAGSLRALMLCGLVFAATGTVCLRRRVDFVALGVALVALAVLLPERDQLWLRLHGVVEREGLVEEDATSVIALTAQGKHGWWMWMGGRSQSSLPFGGTHTALGALPALVHPGPEQVAIIGLGSGDTAWAAGCRDTTNRVRVFELSSPQRRLLERVSQRRGLGRLRRFLADPRVDLEIRDGRHALQSEERTYDLIEADALLPRVAGSGNVYSVGFFEIAARRLRPGGLMCTWAPTRRVLASFSRVFPHVVAFRGGSILVGSQDRIPLDKAAWTQRAQSLRIQRYLGAGLADEILRDLRAGQALTPEDLPGVRPNEDLNPRDEFASPG
jgi:predicted membrane-bound spermidine synthase